jgi:DNA-binding NarL/FixJ family response regulator
MTDYLRLDALTPREKEAARIAARGVSNKEVAAQMRIQEAAVKQYLHRAYEKLGVTERGQLVYKVESLK